jgi:hypothetical protein
MKIKRKKKKKEENFEVLLNSMAIGGGLIHLILEHQNVLALLPGQVQHKRISDDPHLL